MHLSVIDSLARIPRADWNALIDDDSPFLRHEFLSALETAGCATAETGWQPRHLVIHTDGPLRGRLAGAVPLYQKSHSYGEYVFDWAWADAYTRAGLAYYPKLVATVPFTPVTGPRLLATGGPERGQVRDMLIRGALDVADNTNASSLHWLFTLEEDAQTLASYGCLRRSGFQFHWRNEGYASFDNYLSTFSSAKRKKVKQERRYVREAGIEIDILAGPAVTPEHWRKFYRFYMNTVHDHGAIPYLTSAFFTGISRSMADNIVLVLARQDKECIAGALNLRGRNSLYGRYWGSSRNIHILHFETCYYTPIEYCITNGLDRFEAGAQGEHKLARGLLPAPTYSAHWLRHPQFSQAVASYLERESAGVRTYMNELRDASPFKRSG